MASLAYAAAAVVVVASDIGDGDGMRCSGDAISTFCFSSFAIFLGPFPRTNQTGICSS